MTISNMVKLVKSNTFLAEALELSKEMHKKTLTMIEDCWAAVENGDKKLADRVITSDEEIDNLDTKIRTKVLQYLSSMPDGGNVTLSLTLLDISTYLERTADHAVSIAESSLRFPQLTDGSYQKQLLDLKQLVIKVGNGARVSFKESDPEKAKQVLTDVETAKRIFFDIVDSIREDKKITHSQAIYKWTIAHELRRMTQYAKNIALNVLEPYPEAK
ncbi:PhoU domain-containing protein [Candidatus Undinarchaeota archaeon]